MIEDYMEIVKNVAEEAANSVERWTGISRQDYLDLGSEKEKRNYIEMDSNLYDHLSATYGHEGDEEEAISEHTEEFFRILIEKLG